MRSALGRRELAVGLPDAASLPDDMLELPVPPDEPLALDEVPDEPVPLEEDIPLPEPPLAPTDAPPDVRGVTCDPLAPDIDEPEFGGFADELPVLPAGRLVDEEPVVPEAPVPDDEPVPADEPVPVLPLPEPIAPAPVAPDPVAPAAEPLPVVPDPEVCAIGVAHHRPAISADNATILYWCFIWVSRS